MTILDRLRASRWITAPREATWRGPCDYCTSNAEIAYCGRVVERKACRRHVNNAAEANMFDRHMQHAVDTGRCNAQQGPDGQWSGNYGAN